MAEYSVHQSVMLKEVIGFLDLKPGDVVLDATTGAAGHAKEMIKAIVPGGRLIGLDADSSVLAEAEKKLEDYKGSFKLFNDNFRNADTVLMNEGIRGLDGALFDLGVSSYQLDGESGGFSIKHDSRLDMRMDKRLKVTAYDIVNQYREKDLSDIIERFGEERFHNRIARHIVAERTNKPIETTFELAGIIHNAVGYRHKKSRIDPATRTFQAIRIAVNDELGSLKEGLKKVVSSLDLGARICVISFHSLEDRIVKNLFKGYAGLGILKILTKKPVQPSYEEILSNPRSRSAKLRAAERM